MTDEEIGFAILLSYFAAAVLAAVVAALKGRRSFVWFIATLIFPPLLIVLFLLPTVRDSSAPSTSSMPSWTQRPPSQGVKALKDAMNRAGFKIDSDTHKRVMSTFAKVSERRHDRDRADRPQAERPRRPDPTETRTERYPYGREEEVDEAVALAKPVKVKAAIGRVGAVQRTGSRETRIYRRG